MHIKTILAGAALALAATIGSASAAERFSTLDGVTAVAMSSGEMDAVVGSAVHFIDPGGGKTHSTHGPFLDFGLGFSATNSYHGLCVANGGPISTTPTVC